MAKVKFGDVVKEYKGKIDQKNNPYEFYVAGDHMDTDDLTIRRKGRFATDDVGPAFIREFKKGQVLYGSRRTYLRKIAVADFDGVTANTTFVLETKDEGVLRQRLLPFIMYTESFTEWSIKKSKGSTNPYVLFKDLADYEFELPDIDKQDELVELLWSMNDAKDAYNNLIVSIDELVKSEFLEIIQPLLDQENTVPLDDMVEDDRPITYGIVKPGHGFPGGVPVVKVKDMRDGVIDQSDLLLTTPELDYQYRRSRLREGDLLLSIRGSVGRMAEVPASLENANITQDTARLSIKPEYNKLYVRGVLESQPLQYDMEQNIRGVAVKGINIGYLREVKMPVCSKAKQDHLANMYQQGNKSIIELRKAMSEMTAVYKRIIQDNLT